MIQEYRLGVGTRIGEFSGKTQTSGKSPLRGIMDVRFHTLSKGAVRLDAGIMLTVEGTLPLFEPKSHSSAAPWLEASGALADHKGKRGEVTVCYGPSTALLPRIILAGVGSWDDDAYALEHFHEAVASAMRRCKNLRLLKVGLLLADLETLAARLGKSLPCVVAEAVFAAHAAVYSYTDFRSAGNKGTGKKDQDSDFFMPDLFVILHSGKTIPASLRLPVKLAEAEAAGVLLARDLVNAPANYMTPARMVEEALALAKRHGFGCRILHKAEISRLGMGALLAVNEGSGKEARFIILEYHPGGSKRRHPLVLVGKGITFDSGGISLKPAANMHYMKGDMAGAAAVLGAFEAIGRLPECFPWPVVGLIPCTENMPDGSAVRPGDIVTTMSGKTVEILNTDAEGRLILCDALTYAQRNWKPLAVVDIATLTGACMVALGRNAAGVFCDCEALRDKIMELGFLTGDTFWPMPLWQRLRGGLKSNVADIANVGPREGGAIAAALFLQSFVDKEVPWAHIDMAGASIMEQDTPLCPKGGTGFGVRTLVGLARKASDKMFRQ